VGSVAKPALQGGARLVVAICVEAPGGLVLGPSAPGMSSTPSAKHRCRRLVGWFLLLESTFATLGFDPVIEIVPPAARVEPVSISLASSPC